MHIHISNICVCVCACISLEARPAKNENRCTPPTTFVCGFHLKGQSLAVLLSPGVASHLHAGIYSEALKMTTIIVLSRKKRGESDVFFFKTK